MSRPLVLAKNYKTFADLTGVYVVGVDYRITHVPRFQARVGVVAPHGGSFEAHTSEIATKIAGDDFSLYLLEGVRSPENYAELHLTSHYFGKPNCLELLENCKDVVTVHDYNVAGEVVLVGGVDDEPAEELAQAMTKAGLDCQVGGDSFPTTHPNNICDRRRRGVGIQLELSVALRLSSPRKQQLVAAVRNVLLRRRAHRQQPRSPRPLARAA